MSDANGRICKVEKPIDEGYNEKYRELLRKALEQPRFSFDWTSFQESFLTTCFVLSYCVLLLSIAAALLIFAFSIIKVII